MPAGASPLDELIVAADAAWAKVCLEYTLTHDDIAAIVKVERAKREAWMTKSAKAKLKREEKVNDES